MRKSLPLLAGLFIAQSSFALVPTAALTFHTNVNKLNANDAQLVKLETAESLVKKVVASEEFRNAVLTHSYNGQTTFVDNGGFTNEEIYNKILEGAEELNGIKNNTMDIDVELYYNGWTSTVGYTTTGVSKIYMNTKYFNYYTPAEVSGNMTHEWLHKLGFKHAVSYSTSRDYSVPYAIGRIMESLAGKADSLTTGTTTTPTPSAALTAATNVTLSSTSTNVSLKWGAASSGVGIKEYKVYRTLEGSTTTYLQGTTTGLTFTQTSPSKNATYYVKAVDNDDKTINSAKVSYTKVAATLSAPTNLTLSKTTTSVVLKWSAASAATSYKVYRRLEGSSTNYVQSTTSNLTFTQTLPSQNAYYYVRSVDAAGNTLKSAEVKFTR